MSHFSQVSFCHLVLDNIGASRWSRGCFSARNARKRVGLKRGVTRGAQIPQLPEMLWRLTVCSPNRTCEPLKSRDGCLSIGLAAQWPFRILHVADLSRGFRAPPVATPRGLLFNRVCAGRPSHKPFLTPCAMEALSSQLDKARKHSSRELERTERPSHDS